MSKFLKVNSRNEAYILKKSIFNVYTVEIDGVFDILIAFRDRIHREKYDTEDEAKIRINEILAILEE